MKTRLAALAAAICLSAASTAGAQMYINGGPLPGTTLDGGISAYYYPVVPYSYYVAIPYPARGYVGYGNNDFPYYGRAYGTPSDPWTWPYMSASYYGGVLARYYYPPVR